LEDKKSSREKLITEKGKRREKKAKKENITSHATKHDNLSEDPRKTFP